MTLQISVSESVASHPAIIVGGSPFLMTVKISPSFHAWSHLSSVRSGGCLPPCSWMMETIEPWALLPWQPAQLASYARLPAAIDSVVDANGFLILGAAGARHRL